MAAGIFQPFASAGRILFRAGDLLFSSLKIALLTTSWTPDIDTEESWEEVKTYEIPWGNGYPSGGSVLLHVALSAVVGGYKLSSDDMQWIASGLGIPSWMYLALYIEGTVDGIVNPLIAFALGDDTPAAVPLTPAGDSLDITCPALGWVKIAVPSVADFATKEYVDDADEELVEYIDTELSDHAGETDAHGAASAATASRIVMRDASGRAQFADPSADADAATKGSVVDTLAAAGWGSSEIPVMTVSADNYKTGGAFYCASDITNAPFYGVKNANILVSPKDENNVTQFAMSVDGSKAVKLRQYTGGAWTSWGEVGGGGSGFTNFLENSLESTDLSFITNTGCDTMEWDDSEDLSIAGALKIICGSTGTGRKVEIDLSELSDAQITEMVRLSFFYKLTGDDDSVEVYVLNGTDKTYLSTQYLAVASGTLTKYDAAGIISDRTGNKLVFAFKDSSATTIYIGAALLTPRVLPQGAVISEEQAYTPTTQGFGTPSAIECYWRRVGARIQVRGRMTPGTVTASEARLYLPPGLTISSDITTLTLAGQISRSVGVYAYVVLAEPGVTYFTFGTSFVKVNGNALVGAGETFSFYAEIEISGWTSSINLVTDAQEFAFNTQATVNTNDTTSFGYGPNGTTILANTARTYYDVKFKSRIQSQDVIKIEVFNATNSAWLSADLAAGASYNGLGLQNGDSSVYGIGYIPISVDTVRVYFGSKSTWILGSPLSWADVIGYSDGVTKWRVRKISNGNMAEAPASGIYESGSNANGYYVKYVDGTMIQWGVTPSMTNSTTGNRTETFPTPFAGIPVVNISPGAGVAREGYAEANDVVYSITTSTFVIASGRGVSTPFQWYAIGKWNLSRSVAAPGTPVGESTVFASANGTGVAVGATLPIQFNTIIEDSLGCITTGAAWKFTAPVSGLYLITAIVYPGGVGFVNYRIYKNATGTLSVGNSSSDRERTFSRVVRLSQGDYIDIRGDVLGTYAANTNNIEITRLSA